MMVGNEFAVQKTDRKISEDEVGTKAARTYYDFQIDGKSLLSTIVSSSGGHDDFMSCFVEGFREQNLQARNQLLLREPSGRQEKVTLYGCPECGDIGCGRYSCTVSINNGFYRWTNFVYENGYEEDREIENIGPFRFEESTYTGMIEKAAGI